MSKSKRYSSAKKKWVHVQRRFEMRCCDCNLIHTVEFKLNDSNMLMMRAVENKTETDRQRTKNRVFLWKLGAR